MTVFADISGSLDERLRGMTGRPDGVAWEGEVYTPTIDELYLRATILPGDTVVGTVGSGGQDMNVGVYQVDVFAPLGGGKGEAMDMADKVSNRFKRDTELTHDSGILRVANVSRSPALVSDGWYQIPVNIQYYSLTNQRT